MLDSKALTQLRPSSRGGHPFAQPLLEDFVFAMLTMRPRPSAAVLHLERSSQPSQA